MTPNADKVTHVLSQGQTSGGYTADQLEAGVANALKAHDTVAVVDILSALAAVDFDRAARVYKTLQVGIDLADLLDPSHNGSSGAP